MEKIMMLASIRRFVDQNFTEDHVHDGTYFDVFNIELPSDEGDFKEYDAIVICTKKQSEFIGSIFEDTNAKVACVIK